MITVYTIFMCLILNRFLPTVGKEKPSKPFVISGMWLETCMIYGTWPIKMAQVILAQVIMVKMEK